MLKYSKNSANLSSYKVPDSSNRDVGFPKITFIDSKDTNKPALDVDTQSGFTTEKKTIQKNRRHNSLFGRLPIDNLALLRPKNAKEITKNSRNETLLSKINSPVHL